MKLLKQTITNPDPYKPFNISQAIQFENLVFVSGQAAYDEKGDLIGAGDFDTQAHQAFKNLKKVLEASGSDLTKVIKVTIFMKSMSYFDRIVKFRKRYFSEPYPADSIIEVASLYSKDALIEIEAIAYK